MKFRRSLIFIATLLLVLSVGNAANDFYSHTSGVPATGAQGSSATMRAEFDSIVAGFDKLPTMTANGNFPIFVNAGGTALSAVSASTARTNLGVSATGADTAYAFRANNLSDIANAATARTNLGLGSISTQASNSVSITGGSISGITDLTVADGGTGASDAATARTNLGAAYLAGSTSQSFAASNLAFPATQVPSADPNTLDDYEEGTWTPSVGGSATYFIQQGYYTKIGNLVTAFFDMQINVLGTGSGSTISGLPFVSANTIQDGFSGNIGGFASLTLNVTSLMCRVPKNSSTITFSYLTVSGTSTGSGTPIGSSTGIQGSVSYLVP
jgi:hypothetical protein